MGDKVSRQQVPRGFTPLRVKLIGLFGAILVLLLCALAVPLSLQQSSAIRRQLELRGEAVAESLAAAAQPSLRTYDYIALSRLAEMAAVDGDIDYVILHDKEGRVAGFSGRFDLQLAMLRDPASLAALSAEACLVQPGGDASAGGCLEVVLPVVGRDGRWGTVRVGLSLAPVQQQTQRTLATIGLGGAVALLLGILAVSWASRRITRPLTQLTLATQEVAGGDLSQDVRIDTHDEIGILAENFSVMVSEVRAQRRELEHQLAKITRLQAYTQGILESMNEGLVSVDDAGNAAAVNPAAEGIFSRLGLPLRVGGVFPPPAAEVTPGLLALQQLAAGEVAQGNMEIALGEGESSVHLLATGSEFIDPASPRRERILTFRNVTELKRLEAQVRQSERLAALGTLAAGMAHEIRNPLAAIKTYALLLPKKLGKPGFLDKFERTVPREITRINSLLEDLMDLARKPSFVFEPLDMEAFVRGTCDVYAEEMERLGIELDMHAQAELPCVRGDEQQLAKVFGNLVRNALQAMPQGGRLSLDIGRGLPGGASDMVVVVVKDTGAGMLPHVLENVFNPFFTTKSAGTGLGLSIAYKVIEEHGGSLTAESEVGRGTRFTVALPAWGAAQIGVQA